KTLCDALRKDGTNLGKTRKHLLDLCACLLNAFERAALNLHPQWRLDSGQFHVQAIFNRHGPRVGKTWELELRVHLLNQLFVCHSWPPRLSWLEHDGRVVHVERRIVRRTVGPANGSKDGLKFRERADDAVLLLQKLRSLADGNSRKRGRHVQSRAFKKRRHELAADLERQRQRSDQKN